MKKRTFLLATLILSTAILWLLTSQGLSPVLAGRSRSPTTAAYACYFPWVCRPLPSATPTPTLTPTRTPGGRLPDLAIPARFWRIQYAGCPWWSSYTIYARVENKGRRAAGYFIVTINGATATVEGLPRLSSTEVGVSFDFGPAGMLEAFADSSNLVHESNEGNNTRRVYFTPPPPCSSPYP